MQQSTVHLRAALWTQRSSGQKCAYMWPPNPGPSLDLGAVELAGGEKKHGQRDGSHAASGARAACDQREA